MKSIFVLENKKDSICINNNNNTYLVCCSGAKPKTDK